MTDLTFSNNASIMSQIGIKPIIKKIICLFSIWMKFVELEKAFDQVARDVV